MKTKTRKNGRSENFNESGKENSRNLRKSYTDREKKLQEKADAAHLSLSRYLVKAGSDHKMLQTQNIARLIYEIRKIGININQIAHVGNTQKFV